MLPFLALDGTLGDSSSSLLPYSSIPTTRPAFGDIALYRQCSPGFFGQQCDSMCQCSKHFHSGCDDGPSGTGLCMCPPHSLAPDCATSSFETPILDESSPVPYVCNDTASPTTNRGFEALAWLDPLERFDLCISPWRRSGAQVEGGVYLAATPTPVISPVQVMFVDAWVSKAVFGVGQTVRGHRAVVDLAIGIGRKEGNGRYQLLAHQYGGHQFGEWQPNLGDGRGGSVGFAGPWAWEVNIKGSGRTPLSRRGGDGRAAFVGAAREAMGSAALRGLGVPTQHALALVTGGTVVRDRAYVGDDRWEEGGFLVRALPSFLRIGSVQLAAQHLNRLDHEAISGERRPGDGGAQPSGSLVGLVFYALSVMAKLGGADNAAPSWAPKGSPLIEAIRAGPYAEDASNGGAAVRECLSFAGPGGESGEEAWEAHDHTRPAFSCAARLILGASAPPSPSGRQAFRRSHAVQAFRCLLVESARRSAALAAAWQDSGFVHGALNTDNISLFGISLDLNVFGFVRSLNDGSFTPSAVDTEGRYSFDNQSKMMRWGLHRLADALSGEAPLDGSNPGGCPNGREKNSNCSQPITQSGWLSRDEGFDIVEREYDSKFQQCLSMRRRVRLGLPPAGRATTKATSAEAALQNDGSALVGDWVAWLGRSQVDFLSASRALAEVLRLRAEDCAAMELPGSCTWEGCAAWLLIRASVSPEDEQRTPTPRRTFVDLEAWLLRLKAHLDMAASPEVPHFHQRWATQVRLSNPRAGLRAPAVTAVLDAIDMGRCDGALDSEGVCRGRGAVLRRAIALLTKPFDGGYWDLGRNSEPLADGTSSRPWPEAGASPSKPLPDLRALMEVPTALSTLHHRASCGGQ